MEALITVAKSLARHRKNPQQYLKRAISTAYYALFQALMFDCADLLVGDGAARNEDEWLDACRAPDHGPAKSACQGLSRKPGFGADILKFANAFVLLQEKRNEADYNPRSEFSLQEVKTWIRTADAGLRALKASQIAERRRLAACVLLKKRAK